MRLLLIRHGQTPSNVAGALDTAAPGPGLTALGLRQAAAVPDAIADEEIDAIYVSILLRTKLTASPLVDRREIEPIELPGVQEIEAGDLEDRTDREAIREYVATMVRWGDGDMDARMPGGPNGVEFFERFDRDVARVAEENSDGTAVVFSHGAAIRTWTGGRVIGASPGFVASHELDNTGLVVVDGDPGSGWRLVTWHGDPLGGDALADESAADPTGDAR